MSLNLVIDTSHCGWLIITAVVRQTWWRNKTKFSIVEIHRFMNLTIGTMRKLL